MRSVGIHGPDRTTCSRSTRLTAGRRFRDTGQPPPGRPQTPRHPPLGHHRSGPGDLVRCGVAFSYPPSPGSWPPYIYRAPHGRSDGSSGSTKSIASVSTPPPGRSRMVRWVTRWSRMRPTVSVMSTDTPVHRAGQGGPVRGGRHRGAVWRGVAGRWRGHSGSDSSEACWTWRSTGRRRREVPDGGESQSRGWGRAFAGSGWG